MARIAGVDIPKTKKIVIALTYIYGIGKTLQFAFPAVWVFLVLPWWERKSRTAVPGPRSGRESPSSLSTPTSRGFKVRGVVAGLVAADHMYELALERKKGRGGEPPALDQSAQAVADLPRHRRDHGSCHATARFVP